MAGDWIKMRTDLQTHPKVVRILSAMRPHDVQTKTDKFRVIGGLHAVWSVFDTHSVDGRLHGYTSEMLDHVIGWEGFAQAMALVGWLIVEGPETLALPEFGEHNGQSAKRRAEDQKRKRNDRKGAEDVDIPSAPNADKKRTREEKRKNSKHPPIPPEGGDEGGEKKRSAVCLKTYLTECKAAQVKPIPDEDTVFEYAQQAQIPGEFLELHWREFLDRYKLPDSKRYKDWRSVFRKSVRGNWFRLWRFDANGDCLLSSQGVQAQNIHKQRAA